MIFSSPECTRDGSQYFGHHLELATSFALLNANGHLHYIIILREAQVPPWQGFRSKPVLWVILARRGLAKSPPVGRWIWRSRASVGHSPHACLLLRKPWHLCTTVSSAVLRRGVRCGKIWESRASARLILLSGRRWNEGHRSAGPKGLGRGLSRTHALSTHCSPPGNRMRTPPEAASTPMDRSPISARGDPSWCIGRRETSWDAYQSDGEEE